MGAHGRAGGIPARNFAFPSFVGSVAVVDLLQTQYARSGAVSIAYQVLGDGPLDLVFVPPHVSNVELVWEIPSRAAGVRRLAEFSRVITFDKRGTGLSDRMSGVPSLEERMDDVRAMMDAVGSSRAAILGVLEGGPMSVLFAASFRIDALASLSTRRSHVRRGRQTTRGARQRRSLNG